MADACLLKDRLLGTETLFIHIQLGCYIVVEIDSKDEKHMFIVVNDARRRMNEEII